MGIRELAIVGIVTAALIGACDAGQSQSLFDDEGPSTGGSNEGGTSTTSTTGPTVGGMGGGFNPTQAGGSGGGDEPCDPNVMDWDKDGWTETDGDCNDCDRNVNPGAIEVETDPMSMDDPVDENCNGEIDEPLPPPCDDSIVPIDPDPFNAVKALEMCDRAFPGGRQYGVVQAYWARANGNLAAGPQIRQFGIHQSFGPNVPAQVGTNMLVLSSGFARLPSQSDAADSHGVSAEGGFNPSIPPTGFPQDVMGCMGGTDIFDDIALNVYMRAPTNATGFKYRFRFYSFEFAEFVCTTFNDQYIALVEPPPAGSINGNVSFDAMGNPVSVNIAFFDVCDPIANNDFAANCMGTCPPQPSPYCPAGPADLVGTGFADAFGNQFPEDAGATGWLQTTAPIAGGEEFNIRFAIWDTGDSSYDSTVLIDGWEWVATPGTMIDTQPPPQ